MPILRAQVNIERDTSLPEDVSVNTWHFLTTGTSPVADAIITEVHAALAAFYASIDDLLSPTLKEAATVKYYDLSLPTPNPPISNRALTLVLGASATPLPEEVAIVLSFSGDPVAGAPAARRRGRIYLGPLNTFSAGITNGRVLIPPTTRTQIVGAAQTLHNASLAAASWDWGVYSPTQAAAGGSPDAWFTRTEHGWVDDAFDTQRRRGPKATARTTFS